MRPTNCRECGNEFLNRPLLQVEARHTAVKEGAAAAQMDVDEALADFHEQHTEKEDHE